MPWMSATVQVKISTEIERLKGLKTFKAIWQSNLLSLKKKKWAFNLIWTCNFLFYVHFIFVLIHFYSILWINSQQIRNLSSSLNVYIYHQRSLIFHHMSLKEWEISTSKFKNPNINLWYKWTFNQQNKKHPNDLDNKTRNGSIK